MIYSGVDLLRTAEQQRSRLETLNSEVKAPSSPDPSQEDTHGALLRFARFIHQDKKKKSGRPSKKALKKSVPETYRFQLDEQRDLGSRGRIIDIYI